MRQTDDGTAELVLRARLRGEPWESEEPVMTRVVLTGPEGFELCDLPDRGEVLPRGGMSRVIALQGRRLGQWSPR